MAASHILEGRSRADRGEVIFILEEVEGESAADERGSHGAEGVRSVRSGRQQNLLERLGNLKASLSRGAPNTIRQRAQPARRFWDSQGKGGQKSKDLAFLLGPFPSPCLPSVMITGFSCDTSECQHQQRSAGICCRWGFVPNSCFVSCFESITLRRPTGKYPTISWSDGCLCKPLFRKWN